MSQNIDPLKGIPRKKVRFKDVSELLIGTDNSDEDQGITID